MLRGLAVAALLLVLTAARCGGGPAATSTSAPAAEWRANVGQVVRQLQTDIVAAEIGGTTRAGARHALANISDLYALLVSYTDLDGCSAMVGATGAPPRVTTAFAPACGRLRRAAALFAQATKQGSPAALLRATREVGLAEPQLVRAMLALRPR